jgi:hypothetical protein
MKYENVNFDWHWEFMDDRPSSKKAQILALTENALMWVHESETNPCEKVRQDAHRRIRSMLVELYRVQGLVYVVTNAADLN